MLKFTICNVDDDLDLLPLCETKAVSTEESKADWNPSKPVRTTGIMGFPVEMSQEHNGQNVPGSLDCLRGLRQAI